MSIQPDAPPGRIPVWLVKPETAPETAPTQGEPEHLPAVREDQDAEPLEGAIVDDGDLDEPGTLLATIDDLIHGDHAQTVAQHAGYVVVGVVVVVRRIRDSRTPAPLERMMRAAEAVGDHETALMWAERIAEFRGDRHQRRMDLIELPARALAILPQAAIGTGAVLAGTGVLLAAATRDITQVVTPVMVVAETVQVIAVVISVTWFPFLLSLPWITLMVLWVVGRRHEETVDIGWLNTTSDLDMDIQIDETTIARALEALRIPQITAYLKEGLPLQYITPCRSDGRGTHAAVRLPAGVAAEQIAKRRAPFAAGLYRRAQEVWLSTGSEAGILDVWAADKGALAEGAGPYPLLHEGFTDVFKGVPFGKTLRGDPLMAPIIGRNTIIGGMPDQGKSSGARTIALGCALDPTVELQIFVPDSNFDFQAFRPRCSVYVMGAEDEKIEQICLALEAVVDDIQVRGDLLVRYEQEQVTRELASRGIGLHPKIVLLEEAHLAYGHREFGQRIAAADEMIVRLGRKRGVHKVTSTQATTGKSVPVMVTINSSNGIAYAVARHQENDAILGQGAYSAGHRATDLIPGEDRGNAVVKGFTGERSTVAQAYYVSPSKGRDQVTPIITRAMAAIAKRGHGVPGANAAPALPAESRDLLDDLEEVLGVERVRLADVPALLRDLAPRWQPYRPLTGQDLRELLTREGVRTVKTGNVLYLDPAELRKKIAQRSTADLDDWS